MRLRNDGNIQYIASRNRTLQAKVTVSTGAHKSPAPWDVLWDTVELKAVDPNAGPDSNGNGTLPAFPRPGGAMEIIDVFFIDTDNVLLGSEIFFFKSDVTFGTPNAVDSLTDADSEQLIGRVTTVAATHLAAKAQVRVGGPREIGVLLQAGVDDDKLYFSALSTGASNFTNTDAVTVIIRCISL